MKSRIYSPVKFVTINLSKVEALEIYDGHISIYLSCGETIRIEKVDWDVAKKDGFQLYSEIREALENYYSDCEESKTEYVPVAPTATQSATDPIISLDPKNE